MNNTNRAANRTLIFIVGLIFVVVGAAAALLGINADIRDAYTDVAPTVRQNVADFMSDAAISGTSVTWWHVAALALIVLVVVLLVVFIFRQGHDHTVRFVNDNKTEHGETIIDSRVAEQLMLESLDNRPELVSCRVTTYLIKDTPVLKVSALARRGVSPIAVVNLVEERLAALDEVLGSHVLASVHVSGGFRVKTAGSTRL